jgi:multidrug efflux pump subunit AcrA (membrane-fusion protein)
MAKKKNIRKIIIRLSIIAAILIGIFVVWNVFFNKPATVRQNSAAAMFQLEYTVKKSSLADYLEIIGTVDAPVYDVVSLVSGVVNSLPIEEGDRVTKDATLAMVDDLQYRLNYLEAKVDYENAIYETASTQEQTLLQFRIAEKNLAHTVIKSPAAGIISEVAIKEGDSVGQSGSVCTLVQDDEIFVQGYLDEVDLQKVRVGQKVLFEFSSFGLEFEGKVEKISKVANSESGIVVIPTEFSFNTDPRSKGIITGLTCDVKIVLMEKANALFVPINAVKKDQKGTYVLVKGEKEGETVPVYIKTGASSSNTIEVTEGLQEGQKIVITPSAAVLNTFSTQSQQGGLDLGMMGGGGGAPPMQGGGPGW